MMDLLESGLLVEVVRAGGVGQILIALALCALSITVYALKGEVGAMRKTIGEEVFPRLNAIERNRAQDATDIRWLKRQQGLEDE